MMMKPFCNYMYLFSVKNITRSLLPALRGEKQNRLNQIYPVPSNACFSCSDMNFPLVDTAAPL